ncbi:MAG: peptidase M55 [Spirochaetaceae bacterium]|nr:MAG: peptidase M55 [Spirochaetaceae bacterium]
MKYIVAVDCEGVACAVGSPGASLNGSRNLEFAQRQATREADAAARALFDEGATRVVVWDNHNGSLNLEYDALDPRCDIALGVGFASRIPALDASYAGIVFVGYHACDSTVDGVMCHTYSSATYQSIGVNGRVVGELAIDAACAGLYGVPPIFVSSDDKAVAEAKAFFGPIETVTTKEALGWNCAVSKHPKRVLGEIYEGVRRAVAQREQMRPFGFESPIDVEIRYKRLESAETAARRHGWDRVDAYTVRRTLDSVSDFFRTGS